MSTIEASHNVRVLGSGEKTVVLGHGLGRDQSVWKYLIPHLVDKYKVLLFDNMGTGTTNPDFFDLLAILEEFRIEKCIYIGHSLSSMTGGLLSIFRPDLFHKIIMISASPRFLNTEDYHGGFEKEEIDQLLTGLVSNYKSWVSGFAPLVVGGDMHSETVQEFSRTLSNMRPDIALSVYRTVFAFDFRSSLRFVTVPFHILQIVKDMAVPVNVVVYIHRNLGGKSTVEVMFAEGHLPQLSSPEIVIPIIVEHIEHDIADDA